MTQTPPLQSDATSRGGSNPQATGETQPADERAPVRVALLGLGTVGGGLAEILAELRAEITERAEGPVDIVGVAVRDLTRQRDVPVDPTLLTTDAAGLVTRDDVDVVVEVMGGLEPAQTLAASALRAGKAVVTANKAIVARYGGALAAAAAAGRGALYYEAAAAGAIPVVKVVGESLSGNRVDSLMGIVNGTCNFILTQMSASGASFADALAEAQALGYAEADPTSDVGGEDAAYKLILLARLAFDTDVQLADVSCEGIDTVSAADIARARDLGYAVKLLAVAQRRPEGLEARVHPTLVPLAHPLASVQGAFNAVFIEADRSGPLMLYGQGAGRRPTASAVAADLVDAALQLRRGRRDGIAAPGAPRPVPALRRGPAVLPTAEGLSRYYVSLRVADEPGVLAAVASAFASEGVSIASCLQEGRGVDPVDLIFVTHTVRDGDLRAALATIAALPTVRSVASVMRVLA